MQAVSQQRLAPDTARRHILVITVFIKPEQRDRQVIAGQRRKNHHRALIGVRPVKPRRQRGDHLRPDCRRQGRGTGRTARRPKQCQHRIKAPRHLHFHDTGRARSKVRHRPVQNQAKAKMRNNGGKEQSFLRPEIAADQGHIDSGPAGDGTKAAAIIPGLGELCACRRQYGGAGPSCAAVQISIHAIILNSRLLLSSPLGNHLLTKIERPVKSKM